jgi:phospholipid/cholesterol/gamma-HCH transport system substrate-binding protein
MEPDSRYTIIGLIVLGLMAAVLASFVWLTGSTGGSEFRYYTIYFERQSLDGLQVGGDVNMRGIKVGRVESYQILRENINRVNVLIRVDAKTPVSTNSVAVIDRNLVTSIADVNLETEGKPGPPLFEVPANEKYPVIAEGIGELDAISESANSLVVKADEALKNLNNVMSEDNQNLLRDILVGVKEATTKLDARLESFDDAAASFRGVSRDISVTLKKLGRDVTPLSRDARGAIREVRTALADISEAARSMQGNTSTLAARATDAAEIGVIEMRATAQELRQGVDLLTRTLDRLQDPRAAILGPGEDQLGPGETR